MIKRWKEKKTQVNKPLYNKSKDAMTCKEEYDKGQFARHHRTATESRKQEVSQSFSQRFLLGGRLFSEKAPIGQVKSYMEKLRHLRSV